MNKIKRIVSASLVMLLVVAMLLTTACGKKPEPDTSKPVQPGDVSTDVGGEVSGDADDTTTGSDVSGDTTTGSDVSGDATGTTTKPGDKPGTTTKPGDKPASTTTKPGDKPASTTTKPGILNSTTKTTSSKVDNTTTSTTTEHVQDATVKEEILKLFTPAMKGKTVTVLSNWTQGTDEKAKMDNMKAETGLNTKWMVAEGENYGTRLSALINASASPDLAMLGESNFPSFVIKNFFEDLSVTSIDYNNKKIFDTELMDNFTWGGKRYCVMVKNSENSNMSVTFYNKSMFKKLGVTDPGTLWKQGKWNWDTFLDCAQKTADIANNRLGVDLYRTQDFLATAGVGIISVEDSKIKNNIDDPRIVEAWTFVNKLHHEYKVTTAVVGADTTFASGNSAMMLGSSWMGNAGGTICEQMKDDWGIVPYPTKAGVGNLTLIAPRGGAIPLGAKNPDAGIATWVYWVSYDTGMLGSGKPESNTGAYSRDEINDVKRAMWEYKKVPDMLEGVLSYGGEYDQWNFSYDIFQAGMSGINTNIGKWKSALDVNIKRITTEFS